VIRVTGGLPDSEGTATAFSPGYYQSDQSATSIGLPVYQSPSSTGLPRSSSSTDLPTGVPTGLPAYQTWSQGPSESGERFRQRVLREAGDAEFVVFSGLID
jgi:hypothetical protein